MNKIKIIRKFFTNGEAKKEATRQRQLAKEKNILLGKVEVIEAYDLFKANGWFRSNPFKKLGLPAPEQFMVIVHYSANVCAVVKGDRLKKKIVKAVKEKKVKKTFFFVKLSEAQHAARAHLSINYVMNATLPAWKFRYVTPKSKGITVRSVERYITAIPVSIRNTKAA